MERATQISKDPEDEMVEVTLGHPFNVVRKIRRGRKVSIELGASADGRGSYQLFFTPSGGVTVHGRKK